MKPTKTLNLSILLGTSLLASGCSFFAEHFALFGSRGPAESVASEADLYGTDTAVRATVDAVKTAGDVTVMSSHGVRLPAVPLSAITAFSYQFPSGCGGHHFRVYETNGTQILEFEYAPTLGEGSVIRDYLSGPNSFVKPGLWTAYDHTADSISGMNMIFEDRGSGILVGTYSQGPVTGLDSRRKHTLGTAYIRALHDTFNCQQSSA